MAVASMIALFAGTILYSAYNSAWYVRGVCVLRKKGLEDSASSRIQEGPQIDELRLVEEMQNQEALLNNWQEQQPGLPIAESIETNNTKPSLEGYREVSNNSEKSSRKRQFSRVSNRILLPVNPKTIAQKQSDKRKIFQGKPIDKRPCRKW